MAGNYGTDAKNDERGPTEVKIEMCLSFSHVNIAALETELIISITGQ